MTTRRLPQVADRARFDTRAGELFAVPAERGARRRVREPALVDEPPDEILGFAELGRGVGERHRILHERERYSSRMARSPLVVVGDNSKAPLGQTTWKLEVYNDRIEASRKAGPVKTQSSTIHYQQITGVDTRGSGMRLDLVLSTLLGEFVVQGMKRREATAAVDKIRAGISQAHHAARQVQVAQPQPIVVNVTAPAPQPQAHGFTECPRCGADVVSQMKRCPYCSKPFA